MDAAKGPGGDSVQGSRKRGAAPAKPPPNSIVSSFVNELTMNKLKFPRIFLNGEPYPVDQVTSNQTQVHFTLEGGSPRCIRYRLNAMDDEHLLMLQFLLPTYANLTELRFEFCHLTYDHFVFLREMIQENRQIAYLSVTGNPKPSRQSSDSAGSGSEYHHIFVHGTELKSYTAQLCNLGPSAIRLFCSVLTKAADLQSLVSLNLGCNQMGDEGCSRIARMLRQNRTLQALSIVDNKISQAGLLELIECFAEFLLTTAEWQQRRRIVLQAKAKKYFPNWTCAEKNWTASLSRVSSMDSGAASVRSFNSNTMALMMTHPFIKDCHIQDDLMYCIGNGTLLHLNVSYNEITPLVLQRLIDVVSYQKSKFKGTGLQQVVAESYNTHPKLQQMLQDTLAKDYQVSA